MDRDPLPFRGKCTPLNSNFCSYYRWFSFNCLIGVMIRCHCKNNSQKRAKHYSCYKLFHLYPPLFIIYSSISQKVCSNYNAWLSRSEEHTSELQSRFDLVCRLLLDKKK